MNKKKVYVIEERGGFKGWRPIDCDSIKKASMIKIKVYRALSDIYKLCKYYRIKIYFGGIK